MSKTEKPRLSLCVRFETDYTYHASLKTIVTIEYWRDEGSHGAAWSGIGGKYYRASRPMTIADFRLVERAEVVA